MISDGFCLRSLKESTGAGSLLCTTAAQRPSEGGSAALATPVAAIASTATELFEIREHLSIFAETSSRRLGTTTTAQAAEASLLDESHFTAGGHSASSSVSAAPSLPGTFSLIVTPKVNNDIFMFTSEPPSSTSSSNNNNNDSNTGRTKTKISSGRHLDLAIADMQVEGIVSCLAPFAESVSVYEATSAGQLIVLAEASRASRGERAVANVTIPCSVPSTPNPSVAQHDGLNSSVLSSTTQTALNSSTTSAPSFIEKLLCIELQRTQRFGMFLTVGVASWPPLFAVQVQPPSRNALASFQPPRIVVTSGSVKKYSTATSPHLQQQQMMMMMSSCTSNNNFSAWGKWFSMVPRLAPIMICDMPEFIRCCPSSSTSQSSPSRSNTMTEHNNSSSNNISPSLSSSSSAVVVPSCSVTYVSERTFSPELTLRQVNDILEFSASNANVSYFPSPQRSASASPSNNNSRSDSSMSHQQHPPLFGSRIQKLNAGMTVNGPAAHAVEVHRHENVMYLEQQQQQQQHQQQQNHRAHHHHHRVRSSSSPAAVSPSQRLKHRHQQKVVLPDDEAGGASLSAVGHASYSSVVDASSCQIGEEAGTADVSDAHNNGIASSCVANDDSSVVVGGGRGNAANNTSSSSSFPFTLPSLPLRTAERESAADEALMFLDEVLSCSAERTPSPPQQRHVQRVNTTENSNYNGEHTNAMSETSSPPQSRPNTPPPPPPTEPPPPSAVRVVKQPSPSPPSRSATSPSSSSSAAAAFQTQQQLFTAGAIRWGSERQSTSNASAHQLVNSADSSRNVAVDGSGTITPTVVAAAAATRHETVNHSGSADQRAVIMEITTALDTGSPHVQMLPLPSRHSSASVACPFASIESYYDDVDDSHDRGADDNNNNNSRQASPSALRPESSMAWHHGYSSSSSSALAQEDHHSQQATTAEEEAKSHWEATMKDLAASSPYFERKQQQQERRRIAATERSASADPHWFNNNNSRASSSCSPAPRCHHRQQQEQQEQQQHHHADPMAATTRQDGSSSSSGSRDWFHSAWSSSPTANRASFERELAERRRGMESAMTTSLDTNHSSTASPTSFRRNMRNNNNNNNNSPSSMSVQVSPASTHQPGHQEEDEEEEAAAIGEHPKCQPSRVDEDTCATTTQKKNRTESASQSKATAGRPSLSTSCPSNPSNAYVVKPTVKRIHLVDGEGFASLLISLCHLTGSDAPHAVMQHQRQRQQQRLLLQFGDGENNGCYLPLTKSGLDAFVSSVAASISEKRGFSGGIASLLRATSIALPLKGFRTHDSLLSKVSEATSSCSGASSSASARGRSASAMSLSSSSSASFGTCMGGFGGSLFTGKGDPVRDGGFFLENGDVCYVVSKMQHSAVLPTLFPGKYSQRPAPVLLGKSNPITTTSRSASALSRSRSQPNTSTMTVNSSSSISNSAQQTASSREKATRRSSSSSSRPFHNTTTKTKEDRVIHGKTPNAKSTKKRTPLGVINNQAVHKTVSLEAVIGAGADQQLVQNATPKNSNIKQQPGEEQGGAIQATGGSLAGICSPPASFDSLNTRHHHHQQQQQQQLSAERRHNDNVSSSTPDKTENREPHSGAEMTPISAKATAVQPLLHRGSVPPPPVFVPGCCSSPLPPPKTTAALYSALDNLTLSPMSPAPDCGATPAKVGSSPSYGSNNISSTAMPTTTTTTTTTTSLDQLRAPLAPESGKPPSVGSLGGITRLDQWSGLLTEAEEVSSSWGKHDAAQRKSNRHHHPNKQQQQQQVGLPRSTQTLPVVSRIVSPVVNLSADKILTFYD